MKGKRGKLEEEGKEDDRECRQCFEVVFWKEGSSSDIERFFAEDNDGNR